MTQIKDMTENASPAATAMVLTQSASAGNATERTDLSDLLTGVLLTVSVSAGLTASTTQAQGQQPITTSVAVFSTVGSANDAATLPAAGPGRVVVVMNDGANTLQLFPVSGDAIGAGAVNASATVAAGGRALFVAEDATRWRRADFA